MGAFPWHFFSHSRINQNRFCSVVQFPIGFFLLTSGGMRHRSNSKPPVQKSAERNAKKKNILLLFSILERTIYVVSLQPTECYGGSVPITANAQRATAVEPIGDSSHKNASIHILAIAPFSSISVM